MKTQSDIDIDKMKSTLFMVALSITFIDVSLSCNPEGLEGTEAGLRALRGALRGLRQYILQPPPDMTDIPTMRGQSKYINPFKPKVYPSEFYIGKAIKQGEKQNLFRQVKL